MRSPGTIACAILFAAACGGGEPPETEVPPVEEVPAATETAAALGVATLADGRSYLTDAQGRALYLFTADTRGAGTSACDADCIQRWPPLLVSDGAQVSAAAGLQQDLIGSIARADGTHQVTYNGWPLYYYAADTASGMTGGQDMQGSGGEWYLVTPEGDRLESAARGD